MALDASNKIALLVGMPDYKMYTLQHITIQALNSSLVSEGQKTPLVGHSNTSSAIIKSCLSCQNVVDIQGLIQNGREGQAHIMLHGLCHVQTISNHPSTLDHAGRDAIESTTAIQQLLREL